MAREKAGVPYEEGETRLVREKVLLDLSAGSHLVKDEGGAGAAVTALETEPEPVTP
jgi:hypothetical protein